MADGPACRPGQLLRECAQVSIGFSLSKQAAVLIRCSFYEWRKPYRTKGVLLVLGVGVLVTAFLPLWLLVKSMTFGAGFTFFALFPLSVNYPEYRLLVSPTKHLLWNIPTHGESRLHNYKCTCCLY